MVGQPQLERLDFRHRLALRRAVGTSEAAMRIKAILLTALLALASLVWGAASDAPAPAKTETPGTSANLSQQDAATMRVEGEKRFRANCGRCHAAPHKFPPRMMATIVRHMRVRATITDEDMRLVLFYMTQ